MNAQTLKKRSRRLSWLLRHGAQETGLAMDAAGWVAITDVLRMTHLNRSSLDEIVRANNKSRLEISGDRIRASQGHSLAGTPVELSALEASWSVWKGDTPDSLIFHGTQPDAIPGISREGITARQRTHVHLADAVNSRVGKRANVGVLLEISPNLLRARGQEIFRSPNGVVLVRNVPVETVVGMQALSKRARHQQHALRRALRDHGAPLADSLI